MGTLTKIAEHRENSGNSETTDNKTKGTETRVKHRQPAMSEAFLLACWRVEPQLNTLCHQDLGEVRHLEPRLMRLLCYLAANSDAVLARDELVQELWPKVIVNENSLTRAVSELRKHLDTSEAAGVQFIQTIPKRGYRLCKPVQQLTSARVDANQDVPDQSGLEAPLHHARPATSASNSLLSAMRDWRIQSGIVTACLTLVVGLLVGLWNPSGPHTQSGLANDSDHANADLLRVAQTIAAPAVTIPTHAPLSDQVVPSTSWPKQNQLALSANTEDSNQFAGIDTPVMSADKDRFAYIKRDMTGSTVYVGSTDEEAAPVAVFNCTRYLSNLTWSPLGNSLLFASHADMTPAAMFSGTKKSDATLLSLNLDTMEVSRLIEQAPAADTETSPAVNLTWLPPAAFMPSKHSSGLPG